MLASAGRNKVAEYQALHRRAAMWRLKHNITMLGIYMLIWAIILGCVAVPVGGIMVLVHFILKFW